VQKKKQPEAGKRKQSDVKVRESAVTDMIKHTGLKVTRARLAVLQLVRTAQRPLTHSEVVDALEGESWDRATLYRNLMDMAEAGLLRRVALGSTWHFEMADPSGTKVGHAHFVCTECGLIECAPDVQMQLSSTRRHKALQRGDLDIQLHGRCDGCI